MRLGGAARTTARPHSRSRRRLQAQCCTGGRDVLLWGLGYTGVALANELSRQGWRVTGTVRTEAAAARLRQLRKPWRLVHFDPCRTGPGVVSEELQEALAGTTHVLSSIPPLGLPLYDPVLAAQLKALRANPHIQWAGYLSSTGVYGDYGGEWVDESSECRSMSSRGYVRREHEAAWAAASAAAHVPLHIFRLGGIYGPGRSVLESLARRPGSGQAGPGGAREQPMDGSNQQRRAAQKYTSRCHVYDICTAVIASMSAGGSACAGPSAPPPLHTAHVMNVVDDCPAPRSEVVGFTRQLVPRGVQAGAGPTSSPEAAQPAAEGSGRRSGRGEALEEKRVSNAALRARLGAAGLELRFPTYREGMRALVAGDARPFDVGDLSALGLAEPQAES